MKKLVRAIPLIVVVIIIVNMFFSKDVNIVDYSDPEYDSALYWPVPEHYKLSQELHSGNAIDISDYWIEKAAVYAAEGGTVISAFHCTETHKDEMGDCYGFGTGLVIAGDDGRTYQYAHLYPGSMPSFVHKGARIDAGQLIGEVGNTGNSSGAHLHFAISIGNYQDKIGVDPQDEVYKDVY